MTPKILHLTLCLLLLFSWPQWILFSKENKPPLSVMLMESTYRIRDLASDKSGTCFILEHPYQGTNYIVLITAAHVLENMNSSRVLLDLRLRNKDNSYTVVPTTLTIKNDGKPLWTSHPEQDVAVMKVSLPINLIPDTALGTPLLADDDLWINFEIFPGDEISCLGFPLGYSFTNGFPILRSARIASHPILPAKKYPTFLVDMKVFEGNSGGPVFLSS